MYSSAFTERDRSEISFFAIRMSNGTEYRFFTRNTFGNPEGLKEQFDNVMFPPPPPPAPPPPPPPSRFINGCDTMAISALKFLSNHDRPMGGQEFFNSEHLMDIATELEDSIATMNRKT